MTGEGIPSSLQLNYVFKTSDVRVGDELISSGLGGRIPAGYRVGRIALIKDTQADNFKTIKVTPAANFIDNAYVLILQDKVTATHAELSEFSAIIDATDTNISARVNPPSNQTLSQPYAQASVIASNSSLR